MYRANKLFRRRTQLLVAMPGGIGNQLQAYFAGLYLSNLLNAKLVLDHSHVNLNHHKDKVDSQKFREVKVFSRSKIIIYWLRLRQVNKLRLRFLSMIRSAGMWNRYKRIRNIITDYELIEELVNLNPNELIELIRKGASKKSRVRLQCYFPDFYYFNQLPYSKKSLRIDSPSTTYLNMVESLGNNTIGIHLRLGDKLQLSLESLDGQFGILDEKYYLTALNHCLRMREDFSFREIYLFTDDLIHCQKIYQFSNNSSFNLVSELGLHPAEELMLLSKMRYIIASNSGFSLWAAQLAHQSSVIFVPETLNIKGARYQNMPERWIIQRSDFLKIDDISMYKLH